MTTTVAEVGEFGLIASIVARLGAARADTIVGAGEDDTAVLRLPNGCLQLATVDSLVAGVHLRLDWAPPRAIGRKLAAVNLSDIAAMGGQPTHALVALAAPPDTSSELVVEIVAGAADELARWGADVVGGNVARAEQLILDLMLLGQVEADELLLRAGGRPGEVVLVTGDLGAAAAGALCLGQEGEATTRPARSTGRSLADLPAEYRAYVVRRQIGPEPRLDVGRLLRHLGASACIDVSDGLAADLGHLCDASGVGVRIDAERLPVAPATLAVATALGEELLPLVVAGGEDYELLFTAPEPAVDALVAAVVAQTGIRVTAIGHLTPGPERILRLRDGSERPLAGGWRHF